MTKTKWPIIPSSEITPESTYMNRRQFMKGVALGAGALALAACAAPPPAVQQPAAPRATTAPAASVPAAGAGLLPAPDAEPKAGKTTDELGDALTSHEAVTTYNNFYEFGMDKGDPARNSKGFVTSPWTLQVGGLVNRPKTYAVEDLIRLFPPEERIYRLRCVEAWSMVIPWLGFPLGKLLKDVGTEVGREVRAVRDAARPAANARADAGLLQLAVRRRAPAGRGDERPRAPVGRAVREAALSAERRADPAGRAVEVRVQEHQVDREDRPGGGAARVACG